MPAKGGGPGNFKALPSKPARITLPRGSIPVGSPRHINLERIGRPHAQAKPGRAPKTGGSAGGGFGIGTIVSNPGSIITQGYKNLASATGIRALNAIGKIPAEAVNLPSQAAVAAYEVGKVSARQIATGEGGELRKLGHEFVKESPVAHLVKGDFAGALKKTGEHPLGTALEVGGVASGLDRALYEAGKLHGAEAAKLTDKGATNISRGPKEFPAEAVPKGGATVASHPYHKGLARATLEKRYGNKPISASATPRKLKTHFDRFEGEALRVTRATRDQAMHEMHQLGKASRTRQIPGREAVTLFNHGMLADPKVLDKEGVPVYRKQLSEAIEHYSKPPEVESPENLKTREQLLKHLHQLQGSAKFEENPHVAYERAVRVAKAKAALEPELADHGVYTRHTMRAAKLKNAFRFHFRDENPYVETHLQEAGESPFRLGGPEGRRVPVDEVVAKLKAKGVDESQLGFISTRPLQRPEQALVSGRQLGGARLAKGVLTGHNFMHGQLDPTFEAAMRQYAHDRKLIDNARHDARFGGEYVHTREAVAKLMEKHMGHVAEPQKAAVRDYIAKELRAGRNVHFKNVGESLHAAERLRAINPDLRLAPVKVAHPYATGPYKEALGRHLDVGPLEDILDPQHQGEAHDHWQSRLPEEGYAGPVGLAHPTIAKSIDAYEKDLGRAHFARLPSSFWRKFNVAFSVRHVPGVLQEVGLRLGTNAVGVISGMRGTRAGAYISEYARAHPDQAMKLGGQRVEGMTRGSVAAMTQEQRQFIPRRHLEGTVFERPMKWWDQGVAQPITGAPLRAVRDAVKAFNQTTNHILNIERRGIEHPPQVGGYGKHLNNEFKALHGKRLSFIGAMSDVEKAFLRGQLDPKAIDHAAAVGREYFGEWTRSSPAVKKIQVASPFYQWYLNSLRFIYHTMPMHHPVKTGLLSAMETATREQRLAEGQEYKGGFPLGSALKPTDLEPSQQGSLPLGPGKRVGSQYYLPSGAVSAGPLETSVDALLPYASGALLIAHGINPITDKPLTETVEGKRQDMSDINKIGLLTALSIAESFVPPVRYAQSLKQNSLAHTFRPFRTEKTRTEKPPSKTRGGELGSKELGGFSIGGKELGSKELK